VAEVIRAEDRGLRHPFWWLGLIFFAACAVAAALSGAGGAAVVLVVLALACGVGLSGRTTVSLDGEGLELRTALGSHRMAWDEVERVETDRARLVLIGASKQLPLSPDAWSGERGQAARTWLERQLAARGLTRSFNPRASRMTFRGTRVKEGRG
jgi:hypothetical protein